MHKDDKKFVQEQINQVTTPKLKQDAWSGYKRVYQKAFDAEPVSFRKENKARWYTLALCNKHDRYGRWQPPF